MKVNDFLDFPVPEPQYKIPITKSAEEPNTQAHLYAKTAVTSIEGSFEQLKGNLTYNPEDQSCHVELSMAVQSLKVGSSVLRGIMLSGIMLDRDDHPSMTFVGDCKPTIRQGKPHTQLVGQLSMRGQTHPLTFDVACILQAIPSPRSRVMPCLTNASGGVVRSCIQWTPWCARKRL